MNREFVNVILEHGKCSWGKCYFCGWGKREVKTNLEELKEKYLKIIKKNVGKYGIKVFSSGSHLDPNQFPLDFIKFLIEKAREYGFKEIILESRPEFIKEEILEKIKEENIKITIAIGLEIADDEILEKYYKKGFKVEDYINACKILKKNNFGVRTYILLNAHPFLYEKKDLQVNLLRKTIEIVKEFSDSIVIINAYPHKDSELMLDWINLRWKPLDEKEFKEIVFKAIKNYERINEKSLKIYHKGKEILIELDHNNFNFIPKIPRKYQEFIKGVGKDILLHPHFEIWQDYFVRFYEPPKEKEYVLFLPCTYKKPYRKSKTHRTILRKLSGYPWFKKLHIIVVSTPGVIPYEFHDKYPFTHYDWPEWEETEEVKKEYIEITKERVKNFLKVHSNKYKLFFAHFHSHSETLEAIKKAFKELKIEDKLITTLDEKTCEKIKKAIGKENVGSSIVAHEIAINKLKEVLKKHIQD